MNFKLKILVFLITLIGFSATHAEEYVTCYDHQGGVIFENVVDALKVEYIEAGAKISGHSLLGPKVTAVRRSDLSEVDHPHLKSCDDDIVKVMEIETNRFKHLCATMTSTMVSGHSPKNNYLTTNQAQVRNRIRSHSPNCVVAIEVTN